MRGGGGCPFALPPYAAEATGLGFVCVVVTNIHVLVFVLFQKYSIFTLHRHDITDGGNYWEAKDLCPSTDSVRLWLVSYCGRGIYLLPAQNSAGFEKVWRFWIFYILLSLRGLIAYKQMCVTFQDPSGHTALHLAASQVGGGDFFFCIILHIFSISWTWSWMGECCVMSCIRYPGDIGINKNKLGGGGLFIVFCMLGRHAESWHRVVMQMIGWININILYFNYNLVFYFSLLFIIVE